MGGVSPAPYLTVVSHWRSVVGHRHGRKGMRRRTGRRIPAPATRPYFMPPLLLPPLESDEPEEAPPEDAPPEAPEDESLPEAAPPEAPPGEVPPAPAPLPEAAGGHSALVDAPPAAPEAD